MNAPRRGEIWLAELPDDPKGRVVVILSIDALNRYAHDVSVVPITTVHHAEFPMRVFVQRGEGGLHQDSWVKCDQVMTIHKRRLVRGPFRDCLSVDTITRIETAVRLALGL